MSLKVEKWQHGVSMMVLFFSTSSTTFSMDIETPSLAIPISLQQLGKNEIVTHKVEKHKRN